MSLLVVTPEIQWQHGIVAHVERAQAEPLHT
jgi:hypothetical protein